MINLFKTFNTLHIYCPYIKKMQFKGIYWCYRTITVHVLRESWTTYTYHELNRQTNNTNKWILLTAKLKKMRKKFIGNIKAYHETLYIPTTCDIFLYLKRIYIQWSANFKLWTMDIWRKQNRNKSEIWLSHLNSNKLMWW